MNTVRPPAVAGTFYNSQKQVLANDVQMLIADARSNIDASEHSPKAIIAPHAGYIYSGPVAASVYARLMAKRDVIKRVILLGPVHHVAVRGLALPGVTVFATPLGEIPIDLDAVAAIENMPQVI